MVKRVHRSRAQILAIAIALFWILAVAVPSHTQTAPAGDKPAIVQEIEKYAKRHVDKDEDKDEIEKEIEEFAERHVNNDMPMQTEMVVNLYRDNKVGLTPKEIAEKYEEKYDELNEKKKSNIWEQLNPSGDWLVACILFVCFLFQNALREFIGGLIKAIVSRPCNWFKGTALFHSFSLRRYRKALRDKYKNLPVSFGPNIPLQMQDVYVRLNVTVARETNQTDASEAVNTDQMDDEKAVNSYNKMMLIGPPGSGKSMFLKHLVLSYANGSPDLPDRQRDLGNNLVLVIASIYRRISKSIGTFLNGESQIAILLEMHQLSDPNKSLKQHLVEALDRDNFPNAERFVSKGLNGGRLMLLLDGLDEVNRNERPRVVEEIRNFLDYLGEHHCQVIITCRTAIYENQFDDRVDETLKIVEFNDKQIREFLKHWTPFMPKNKSSEQLMQTLLARPRIMDIARNPLLLTIIAYLYTNTSFVLPNSRAEFYQEATRIMLRVWHQKHNQYYAPEKLLVLEHLGLYFQDNANQQQQDPRSVDYEQVLAQVKDVLPRLNLNSGDVKPLLKEIVDRSGLLLEIDGGERYKFAHWTLQEFLAAAALRKNPEGIVDRFHKDPNAWRETTKLWCSLAEDSTEVIEKIYEKYPIIAFECLADAKEVSQDVPAKIINTLKNKLSEAADIDDQIINFLAGIAVENSPDGLDMFNFLEEKLYDRDLICRSAAKALSLTNLPKAARVLASHYNERSEVREHLERMGALAVPELLKLCNEGSQTAINGLRKIKTPEAKQAWVGLMDEGR